MASEIIKAQDKEIAQLKQWRTAWYPSASITPVAYDEKTNKTVPMPHEQMQGMMMNMDLGSANTEFDLRFINAIDLSKNSKARLFKALGQNFGKIFQPGTLIWLHPFATANRLKTLINQSLTIIQQTLISKKGVQLIALLLIRS